MKTAIRTVGDVRDEKQRQNMAEELRAARNAVLWLVGRVDACTGQKLSTLHVLCDGKPYRLGEIVRPLRGDPWRVVSCRSAMLECIMEAAQQCHDATARANANGDDFTRVDFAGGVLLVMTARGMVTAAAMREYGPHWND